MQSSRPVWLSVLALFWIIPARLASAIVGTLLSVITSSRHTQSAESDWISSLPQLEATPYTYTHAASDSSSSDSGTFEDTTEKETQAKPTSPEVHMARPSVQSDSASDCDASGLMNGDASSSDARTSADGEPIIIRRRVIRRRRQLPDEPRRTYPITIDLFITYDDPSLDEPSDFNTTTTSDCTWSSVEAPKDGLGLHSFELVELVGVGSYARVIRARVRRSGDAVALKLVRATDLHSASDLAYLRNEMQVLRLASGCALLCELLAAFNTPRFVCFVLPLAACDLLSLLEQRGALRDNEARFYAAQLVLALEFLHRRAVVYRDLKPDNVLVNADGYVKLADFGMCKLFANDAKTNSNGRGDVGVFKTRTFCGSLTYMAPETLRGDDYGFSCDFWSLGVLLYELLAARSPFAAVNQQTGARAGAGAGAGASLSRSGSGSGSGSIRYDDVRFIERIKRDNSQLVSAILEKPVYIPRTVSVRASSLLKGLLQREPESQLGCIASDGRYVPLGPANLLSGLDDTNQYLKAHVFFRGFDWVALENRSLEPPVGSASLQQNLLHSAASNGRLSLGLGESGSDIEAQAGRFDFSSFDYVSESFSA